MSGPKPLPQKITAKMNKRELAKYEKLTKEWIKANNDADKAQSASTQYYRKIAKIKEPTKAQLAKDQKLINAGFRAGYFASKKSDEYKAFKDKMMKKYYG